MLKRFTLASVFLLFLISPAHATPDKDLKDWTEQDILSVNASLQSALRPVSYTHLTLPTTPYV